MKNYLEISTWEYVGRHKVRSTSSPLKKNRAQDLREISLFMAQAAKMHLKMLHNTQCKLFDRFLIPIISTNPKILPTLSNCKNRKIV